MSRLVRREYRRILIIKPSSIGDVVHTLPGLHGLRRRYPNARISWLLSLPCMDLLADHPDLDERIPFDRKRYGRIGRSPAATGAFAEFLEGLRARGFDLAIDLQGLFRSGFLALASGARTRIGPDETRELAGVFYTDRIPSIPSESHAVDRYYGLAALLGFDDVPARFHLPISGDEREAAHDLLGERDIPPDGYAAMFPSARWETKIWPAEKFAAVADHLWQEHQLRTVIMGTPSDAELGTRIQAAAHRTPVGLFQITVRQMVALIGSARLVVGNDSGPIHIAAALARPLVTVVGPTSAIRTGPYGRPATIVRRELACAPCFLKRVSQCPHEHACMRDLAPETVLDACRRELAEASVGTST